MKNAIALTLVLTICASAQTTQVDTLYPEEIDRWELYMSLVPVGYSQAIGVGYDSVAYGDTLAFLWEQPMTEEPADFVPLDSLFRNPMITEIADADDPSVWLVTGQEVSVISKTVPRTTSIPEGEYAVAVRCFDKANNGSGFSNKIFMRVFEPDVIPPTKPIGFRTIIMRQKK